MKRSLICLIGAALLALTGCESLQAVRESVKERVAGPSGRQQTFQGDKRQVYGAAKVALEEMGFRFLRGGPAQGEIDAISGLRADDALRSSRQLSMKVRLRPAESGTEVTVVITEIIESDYNKAPGMGTGKAMKDSGLYDVFFGHIGQALARTTK